MDQLRSALAAYAADSDTNKYPAGEFNFSEIRNLLPRANLLHSEEEARLEPGSFTYISEDGTTFTMRAISLTRQREWIYGSPSGITPESFEH